MTFWTEHNRNLWLFPASRSGDVGLLATLARLLYLLETFLSARHQTGFVILAITNFYMTVAYFERWCIQKALTKQAEKILN